MRITPAELFAPRWSCFWATSYQFDPALFEQFLFGRLGDPPVNATILLDATKLDETWAAMRGNDQSRVQRAGRDYLIRGVRPGSGSFHAKTYFFANDRDGILMVGSGNLDLRGLEQGLEVFSRFASGDPSGLATIRSWRDWMQGIVDELDEEDVRRRWWDLRSRARWLGGVATSSDFVSNANASMMSQLCEGLPSTVDELHVLAPFMDRQAAALEALVTATRPRQLHFYVGRNLSVDGPTLETVLTRLDCDVHLWRFEPDRFIHAKLVGVIWGDRGRLMSGSANVSRAAFTTSRESHGWANVEAGVVSSVSADEVRSLFEPPELSRQQLTLEAVTHFTYEDPAESEPRPYFVRFASRLDDGRVTVAVDPVIETRMSVSLTDGTHRSGLVDNHTEGPLESSDRAVIVWLEDTDGTQLSNVVVLDDAKSLAAWLQELTQRVDKPKELDISDLDTPVGAMLQRLHRTCIFDVDETAAVSNAQRALDAGGAEEADPGFWDKLVQEELDLDRRVPAYRQFSGALSLDDDEVLLLLREMLGRTPQVGSPPIGGDPPPDGGKAGTAWTPNQKLQVRLVHVLERWCKATSDPRLRWLNPAAPVRNYAALLSAIAECWEHKYIPQAKLLAVQQTLFESLLTDGETAGFLLSVDDADRASALQRLPDDARSLAAALVYVALLQGTNWLSRVFDWQSFMVPGIELGVFQGLDGCDAAVHRLSGVKATPQAVEDRLLELANYVDDPHWCSGVEKSLHLDSVLFQASAFAAPFKIAMAVTGINDPLTDPRLVALLRRAFQYKRAPGIVVTAPDWRLSVADGEPVFVRLPSGAMFESTRKVTASYLTTLDQQRIGFGDIFAPGQDLAS